MFSSVKWEGGSSPLVLNPRYRLQPSAPHNETAKPKPHCVSITSELLGMRIEWYYFQRPPGNQEVQPGLWTRRSLRLFLSSSLTVYLADWAWLSFPFNFAFTNKTLICKKWKIAVTFFQVITNEPEIKYWGRKPNKSFVSIPPINCCLLLREHTWMESSLLTTYFIFHWCFTGPVGGWQFIYQL